jgi:CRISPR-associated exonuclease Cas4
MFSEDDLLPLSGLQHLRFCERQWGLIHLEQQWEENRLTAEGRLLHDRVHERETEARPGILAARGLHIRSLRLGVTGIADVVEFHRTDASAEGVRVAGRDGWWRPFPVEYKRGRPKPDSCDEVQLCAQAMCLEEMFETRILAGALFYGETRRRADVAFDEALRAETQALSERMQQLYAVRKTPAAEYSGKCERCSLYGRCLPRVSGTRKPVSRYFERALRDDEAAS